MIIESDDSTREMEFFQASATLESPFHWVAGTVGYRLFAPLNPEGELEFGYIFARSASPAIVRKLTHIRGIGEMSTICDGDGNFKQAVTVPNAEVQALIAKHKPPKIARARVGEFVEILSGEAKGYCGTITVF